MELLTNKCEENEKVIYIVNCVCYLSVCRVRGKWRKRVLRGYGSNLFCKG